MPRYSNAEYDALVAELAGTANIDDRARIVRTLNDMLMQEGAMIPLIHRGRVSAHSNKLGGVIQNTWDSELWNVADWYRN